MKHRSIAASNAAARSAERRRCPACGRSSALVDRHLCRWCGHDTDLAPTPREADNPAP